MPRKSPQLPKYRHYKPKDLAVVRLDGKDHYLGKHGSEQSKERYRQLIAGYLSSPMPQPGRVAPPGSGGDPTVDQLLRVYWDRRVVPYYVKNGRPTSEVDN